jgi:hypothetical protein
VDSRRSARFSKWIQQCDLMNLGSVSPRFTWRGQKSRGHERVFERLDRGLGNHLLRHKFPDMFIKVLPRVKSGHHSLLNQFLN